MSAINLKCRVSDVSIIPIEKRDVNLQPSFDEMLAGLKWHGGELHVVAHIVQSYCDNGNSTWQPLGMAGTSLRIKFTKPEVSLELEGG